MLKNLRYCRSVDLTLSVQLGLGFAYPKKSLYTEPGYERKIMVIQIRNRELKNWTLLSYSIC